MTRFVQRGAALAAIVLPSIAAAQASPGESTDYLIRGGTVITETGAKLPNTNILVHNGRITQMGANVTASAAKVIDATGKFVYPGMIDANTGIGLQEIGGVQTMSMRSEMGQFNPHIRALVGLNVESEILGVTRMNGVTSVITSPTGGSISGQATLINTAGWTWEDLAVQRNAGIVINLPGGGAGRGRGGGGGGRGGGGSAEASMAELTTFMQASQDYNTKRTAGAAKLDLVYEAMRPLFKKEVPAIIPANTEAQIKAAIDFGELYGLRVVIQGGAQAYKVRTLLAQKKIPVVLGSIQSAPGDDVPYDEIYAQPGLLNDAGVKFAFSTGNGSNARHVSFHAALAVAYGLAPDAALKALTIWPAEIFGAEKDIGSIAQGKLANFFITTGDPLDLRTQVVDVFIKGRQVPDDDRHNRLYLKYKARPLPVVTP
jgi:imidazolonepropionase-like amidohydrolase